jgi:HAD superfamily hydrolase (TIGR01450 family)
VTPASPAAAPLSASAVPLAQRYDVALLDLDGVVYVGAAAVAEAPGALTAARRAGMRLAFVTNNAARPPDVVAAHLVELGIDADPAEVVTSAQAAAHYLADELPSGSHVLVVGTVGLTAALREVGLVPVDSADDAPVAVVQGYSPTLDWPLLAEGAVAIGRGALWVATNLDRTVPSRRGPLPGNGSMVAALRHATGATPIVTGKPDPTMHRESVRRSGATAPLVVGDRLDTDIEGATAAACPSLLVLSGVTTAAELLAATPPHRPTYLANDLRGLLVAHPAPQRLDTGVRCGAFLASGAAEAVVLRTVADDGGAEDGDELDALRALCRLNWDLGGGRRSITATDDAARAQLVRLGLA